MSDSNNNLVESQHILVCKCCGAPQLYQICSVALNAVTSGLYSLCTFEEKIGSILSMASARIALSLTIGGHKSLSKRWSCAVTTVYAPNSKP